MMIFTYMLESSNIKFSECFIIFSYKNHYCEQFCLINVLNEWLHMPSSTQKQVKHISDNLQFLKQR